MRSVSIAVLGFALAFAPVNASIAAPANPADPSCAVSVAKAQGSSGFQLEQKCAKPAVASKTGSNLAIARAPIVNGSELGGENAGSTIIISLLAFGAFVGGLIVLFDDGSDVDLPTSP